MKVNMQQWVQRVLLSDERLAFPLMASTGLEMTGMHILDVVKDGKRQAQCIQALASRYPSAASITLMDLSVEAEAFGSAIRYTENETPTVIGKIVEDRETACALEVPAVGSGRTSVYLEAAALSAAEIKDRPLFGCHIGPFSLAGRLCGMTEILVNTRREPETVHVVLGKCTDFLVQYAQAFKDSGANGIVIAEPAAGLISPAQCDEFSSHYVSRIVKKVQDEGFMVILHNCGSTKRHAPSMLSTGAMGLHFGNAVDLADILPQISSPIIVFGNLDPVTVFRNGTTEAVRAKTGELLIRMSSYKNFVISSGCDIPPGTPLRNIDEFFAAVRAYNDNTPWRTRASDTAT